MAGDDARRTSGPGGRPGAGGSAPAAPGADAAEAAADDGRIVVGAVAGAFGTAGEVRLKSFCADPAAIADYAPLTDDAGRERRVRLTRPVKGGFAARLSGVATREQAEAMRGVRLHALRTRLPSLPDDEYYHADLIGLAVVDAGGRELGRVTAIHDFGAGDLLEVADASLKEPALLPFTREAVPTVDLSAGRIVADPPAGVFPDDGPAEDDAPGDDASADADGADADDDPGGADPGPPDEAPR